MLGLREAGVLGASLAVAGGVAYIVWNYTSSTSSSSSSTSSSAGKKPQQDVTSEQPVVVPAAAPPVVATEPKKPSEVLVLGLDGAGKTSLLNCFSTGCLEPDVQPTEGFNAVSINRENLHIDFLEIGGKEELRPYWQKYMSRALLLVFVVDSSSPELFPIAKKHLHELLAPEPDLPLMVLANKQDLPGSCGITDLHEALSLSELGDRRLLLIDTYVIKGEAALGSGVQDARDLIIQMVCDGK
ncbi:ADP-ribosylation factor-like protein 9 isoform X2 [Pseudoliparis swirei]|uniref:ADP-ribosylation factor-like protein 9 isoform X2 n=1 Tax=Pseudoliparis swirei TaxID=2059687 RepID=UPI0024BD8E47|nr:ADP-ribosylation factor-like protein 9 isoform X2 [Pseudoliparis swirei]